MRDQDKWLLEVLARWPMEPVACSRRAVRPDRVVVVAPLFDKHFRLLQSVEDLSVEQLLSEFTVEALVVAVPPG